MQEKLDELKNLNDKFYKMFGELFRNRKLLDNAETYKYFGKKLFEQYKVEYEVLQTKFETIEKPALYEAQVRHDMLVPRKRFIFFRNRAQKLIDDKVICELDKYFAEREEELRKKEEALERLLEALDSVGSRTTAFDEPLAEQHEPQGQDELEEGKSPESAAPAAVQEAAEQTKTGDNVALMQNTEPTKGPGKTQPKGKIKGQMSIDDVQTSEQTEKPDGG